MIRAIFFTLLVLFCFSTMADDNSVIEKFSVLGEKESLPTEPGSAHLIDEAEMAKFSFSDIHRLLQSVPGVNIQEEDGFGLRPNIGLRGAHPHRSKKITVMEDGVLIAPAPYSAPAAYYFPSLEKVQSLEVFKGPTSLRYGPQSVGGAINMLTGIQPHGARLDVEYGSFNLQKYQAGVGIEGYGDLSLQLNRSTHDGFKELPSGEDTGFERNNIFLRWDKYFATRDQNLTVKVNWSNEQSRETYLGLALEDFVNNPFQRYAASERDEMAWEHKQFFLNYAISAASNWRVKATTYYHEFSRSWDKLDGFYDRSLSLREIVSFPDFSDYTYFYQVLKGEQDSSLADNRDSLRLTDNRRSYLSQGAQLQNTLNFSSENWDYKLTASYRLHQDQVRRNHLSNFYNMAQGNLVATNLTPELLTQNFGAATAHTFSIYNEMDWDHLSLSLGSRFESISYSERNDLTSERVESSDQVVAPGAGLFYEFFPGGGVLAGVHRGITPVGPGQADSIKPESAINYELGFRYSGRWGFELISFFSDYENILGTCTQSSGCGSDQLDQQFNGGKAEVYGVESLLSFQPQWKALSFSVRMSVTLTEAQFSNAFTSGLADWGIGEVRPGDPIPYIPRLQGNLSFGLLYKKWRSYLSFQYTGSVADQAVALNRQDVPERWVLDYALHYQVLNKANVYFKANNLTAQQYAVSFRPFGLRPGRPQSFFVGLSYDI